MVTDKDAIRTTEFQPGLGRQLWPDALYIERSPHPYCDFLFRKKGREGSVRVKVIKRRSGCGGTTVFITDGRSEDDEAPDHQMNGVEEIVYQTTSGIIDFKKKGVTLRVFKTGQFAFWA